MKTERGVGPEARSERASRCIAIAGLAMLWPSIHNQLLYPMTFLYSKIGAPSASLIYFAYLALFASVVVSAIVMREALAKRLFPNGAAMAGIGLVGVAGNMCLIFCDFSSTVLSTAILALGITCICVYVPVHFAFWSTVVTNSSKRIAVDVALSYLAFCVISGVRLSLGLHASFFAVGYALAASALGYVASKLIVKEYDRSLSSLRLLPLNIIIPSVALAYLGLFAMQPLTPADATFAYPPDRSYLYWINALLMLVIALLFKDVHFGGGKARFKVFSLLCIYLAVVLLIVGFNIALPLGPNTNNFMIIASRNALECFILIATLSAARHKCFDPILPTCLFLGLVVIPANLIRAIVTDNGLLQRVSVDTVMLACGIVGMAFVVLAVSNVVLMATLVKPGANGKTNEESPSADERKLSALKASYDLSDREMDIARLAYQNLPAKKIAEQLFIAESTVYVHLKHIYRKTDVHSKQDLINLIDTLDH